MKELRLGTRGSQLALWQAQTVAARIEAAGGPPCRLIVIKTSGDQLQDAPLSDIGGKRLFVKEIEDALLRRDVDLAVHSSKDMPAQAVDGLEIAAVLPREDPLDVVVLPRSRQASVETIAALVSVIGQTPTLGTGSVRRIAQLKRLFPSARFEAIRGNLDTRLRKLDEDGQHDALILAAAGMRRLGFESRISFTLPAEGCVPAPGQGIVAVETRADDAPTRAVAERIDDVNAATALVAERALVAALGGGCQTPVGALATLVSDQEVEIVAAVVTLDGTRVIRTTMRGPRMDARGLGARAAEQLLSQGAGDILAEAKKTQREMGELGRTTND